MVEFGTSSATGAASKLIHSFKRARRPSDATSTSSEHRVFNERRAAARTAKTGLSRELKGRHLQMIAIGGSIGAGLWIGTGTILNFSGPGSVCCAYLVMGMVLYITMQAMGELAATFPVAGSFAAYGTRFIDPAWGFAMGWNYVIQWLVVIPLEIIAALKTLTFWQHSLFIPEPAAIAIFLVSVFGINLCGVRAFGEAEFVASLIKAAAVVGFIILGLIVDFAGNQEMDFIGVQYWKDPGAFKNGFRGFCAAVVTAAFAFTGTELVGLAAAETQNPTRVIPTACRQVFWRITCFYIASVLVVGLVVDSDDPRLTEGADGDPGTSPFVIAIQDTGITGLDSVMNAVILVSVLSVANSSFFGSSRVLAALAAQRQAPSFLRYVDRSGRPLVAVGIGAVFGLLAFVGTGDKGSMLLDWLVALSGQSSLFTWGSICLAHIQFRKAWKLRGHSLDELVYQSPVGVPGSWIGLGGVVVIFITQFYVAIIPDPTKDVLTVRTRLAIFFQTFLAVPVVMVCYLGFKIWRRTRWVSIDRIDVDTGRYQTKGNRRSEDRAQWPVWKKVWRAMF